MWLPSPEGVGRQVQPQCVTHVQSTLASAE